MHYRLMNKEKNKQANFRLPESLVEELQRIADKSPHSQTEIATKGIRKEVKRLARKYDSKAEVVTA